MALKRLSEKATFVKFGYGQVEPNHLSAQRTAEIYAQLPAKADIAVLENGMFVKYDYAAGKIDFTGEGPWMMVFNEEKLYDERKQMHRDYAMKKSDFYDGVMTPRVFRMYAGDIFTTNKVHCQGKNIIQLVMFIKLGNYDFPPRIHRCLRSAARIPIQTTTFVVLVSFIAQDGLFGAQGAPL